MRYIEHWENDIVIQCQCSHGGDVFLRSLLCRAAWDQREYEWLDTAVLSEGTRLPLGHRC